MCLAACGSDWAGPGQAGPRKLFKLSNGPGQAKLSMGWATESIKMSFRVQNFNSTSRLI